MSNALMLTQMGIAGIQAVGGYFQESARADLQERIQQYRNTMLRLSAARAENAVTVNEARVRDQGVRNQIAIQMQARRDQAELEVQAAAAGVGGNSVELAARDLRASAGRVSFANKRQIEQQRAELREQKTTIAINAITGQDIQVIPKPSIGATLLGLGTNLLNIYDSYQPEGGRIFGYNGEAVGGRRGPLL